MFGFFKKNKETEIIAKPLTLSQGWVLGLSALLIKINGGRYDILGGFPPTEKYAKMWRKSLKYMWKVQSKEQLLGKLSWLEAGGHRVEYEEAGGKENIIAWDMGRYVALCGMGYVAGYFTEEEAWKLSMPKASMMQATYSSWRDFAEHYILGRSAWGQDVHATEEMRKDMESLLADPESPWVKYSWNTALSKD